MTTTPAPPRVPGRTPPPPGPLTALDTPHPLETLLGDPHDPGNPTGHRAFTEADEHGDFLPAGRKALETYGFGAEFVPTALGGRLRQADELARVLRTVFRRDGSLGLGHGAINLIASSTVWAAGSLAQHRRLADVLLHDGQTAGAITELAHGDDIARTDVTATPHDDGSWRLNGRKEVINNIARARTVTVLARTADGPGNRSHSLFLLDTATLPRDRARFLPRYRTSGMRATHLGGIDFRDCPVPADAVVGAPGDGMETILRCFQVTKSVASSALVGALDTMLRTVTGFALDRRLYGRRVADLPHARALLAGAATDLLIGDSLATTACRALHVLPRQTSVYAAATKYLVPILAQAAADDLATVLGARSFLREGPHAVFQKHLRDLPVAALAHSGATVCQATLVPQLTRLARKSWFASEPAEPALFHLGTPLPALDFGRLAAGAGPDDRLMATLVDVAAEHAGTPVLGDLCGQLLGDLRDLTTGWTALAPRDRNPFAGPVAFQLAERYTLVLAAAAVLGMWRHNQDHPRPFHRDTAWPVAALDRIAVRLGHPPLPAAAAAHDAVLGEVLTRHETRTGFDITARALC